LDSKACHKKTGLSIDQWVISKFSRSGQKPDTADLQLLYWTKSWYGQEFIISGILTHHEKTGHAIDQWAISK
jgi:hypothetical protein